MRLRNRLRDEKRNDENIYLRKREEEVVSREPLKVINFFFVYVSVLPPSKDSIRILRVFLIFGF